MTATGGYDVVVIGSGCTGGTAAWRLCRAGVRVLLLEAGGHVSAEKSQPDPALVTTLKRAWRAMVSRRQHTQSLHPAYWVYHPRLFVDDKRHPYSTPEGRPFAWIRGRQVGGRSLTWAGLALRFSPYELQDWPVSYESLAPYYDDVERVMGICGAPDHLPQLPDGAFRGAKPLTTAESLFGARIASRWPDRRVIAARGVDEATQGGWSLKTSLGSTLALAQRTGLLEIQDQSIARRLLVDSTGRVSGVEVVDGRTKVCRVIPARTVVVCASTLESVKLLLNSVSKQHRGGLGNSSGLLGRYIMNKVSRSVTFVMELDHAAPLGPLSASESFVIPRYENLGTTTAGLRGGFGMWGAIQRLAVPQALRKADAPGLVFGLLIGYGECLPYVDNQVTLDRAVTDEWGNPTLRIDVRWRENEELMGERIREDLLAMVATAGGRIIDSPPPALVRPMVERVSKAGAIPGRYVHEVGGARMGTSSADSVVNPYGQLWDSTNVFVTDGACWPTAGWQNPTLTMMAMTARSCDFLARRLAAGEL
ncbi:MAG: GMC family oxidoreductase [Vicinamibacterales bacterium]